MRPRDRPHAAVAGRRRALMLATAAAILFVAALAPQATAMLPADEANNRPSTKSGGDAAVDRAAAAAPGADADVRLAAGQEVKFIVTFKGAVVEEAARAARSQIALERTLAASRAGGGTETDPAAAAGGDLEEAARVRGLAAVKSAALAPAAAAMRAGARVSREYSHLPSAAVAVSSVAALEALRSDPAVESVTPVGTVTRALAESLPLVLQPNAVANNFLGAGCSVAIIDGGGDYWTADLGSCSAVGAASPCRVKAAVDFTGAGFSGDSHGSNVASTVARLAPGADILLLDVFSSDSTTDDIILAAVNWVVANRAQYNICSMNLSLGDGSRWGSRCTNSAYEAPFAAAKAGGVLTAVASGNSYYSNGVSEPACAPSAVSVGAVHDSSYGTFDNCDTNTYADRVTCFTNIVSWLDMLAPGAKITAGGYTMSGTSMAAPHIAGAAAVLRAAAPGASVDQVITALKQGGKQVQDWYTLQWFPRLDLAGSLSAIGASSMDDTDPPVVSQVRINNGAATTLTTAVTVSVTAGDPSGIATRCASNDNVAADACAPWVPFVTPFAHTLAAGPDGPRTVYVYLNDTKGNAMQTPASATINYDADTDPPSSVVVRINNGATSTQSPSVTLTVTAYDLTGLGKMCISNTQVAPADCTPWVDYKASSAWALDATGGDGARTVYVALEDKTGNRVAAPTAASIFLDVDDTPPTVTSVSINNGAATTGAARVTMSVAATDDRGAGGLKMCVANDNSAPCNVWATLLSSFPWELAAGEGTRTVYVTVRDQAGNVSPAASDSIEVNAASGPSGTVTVNGGVGYTNKASVPVAFAALNGGAPAEYAWTTSPTGDLAASTSWYGAPGTASLALSAQGTTLVRAVFRDATTKAIGPEATASVIYDTAAPGEVTNVRATLATTTSVTLSWSLGTAVDAGSGRAGFLVAYRTGTGLLPPKCGPARRVRILKVDDPDAAGATVSRLSRRRLYRFRVCAVDRVGNVSPGALGTAATLRRKAKGAQAAPSPSPSPAP